MTTHTAHRIERTGHLRWVDVSTMQINPRAQRLLRPGWAAQIAADFDPDRFMPPLVSLRHGKHFIIDGQHRVAALRLMGWDDQQVQCWVYENLTEAQEADLFLWHDNRKACGAFEKFNIAVTAERSVEQDIDRIVRSQGLKISKGPGGIAAVSALRKVYAAGTLGTLARTLRLARDAYGDDGLHANVIEGLGLLCARFNGELDDAIAVKQLQSTRGGIGALNTRAAVYRKSLGKSVAQCYAAAAAEIINAGMPRGKKLPGWWT